MTASSAQRTGTPSSAATYPTKDGINPTRRLIGVEGLAAWLDVEIVFVRRLVAERRIPFLKIGKYVRFDPVEVSAWINDQRVGVFQPRSGPRGRW
jgi:excisionase family DNA binding protein